MFWSTVVKNSFLPKVHEDMRGPSDPNNKPDYPMLIMRNLYSAYLNLLARYLYEHPDSTSEVQQVIQEVVELNIVHLYSPEEPGRGQAVQMDLKDLPDCLPLPLSCQSCYQLL